MRGNLEIAGSCKGDGWGPQRGALCQHRLQRVAQRDGRARHGRHVQRRQPPIVLLQVEGHPQQRLTRKRLICKASCMARITSFLPGSAPDDETSEDMIDSSCRHEKGVV